MTSWLKAFTLTAFFYISLMEAVQAGGDTAKQAVLELPFNVQNDQGVFLIVTDIHFDPFADPSILKKLNAAPVDQWKTIFESSRLKGFSQFGRDTNYPLMMSAIQAAQSLETSFDFVFYPGDYLSHNFTNTYQQYISDRQEDLAKFVEKTMLFVGNTINSAFSDAPTLGTFGNNDSICGDYMIYPDSPLLKALKPVWKQQSEAPLGSFRDFTAGGSYSIPHPTVPNHEIISLNNIYWSIKYTDRCNKNANDPGNAQLLWLEQTLSRLKQQGRSATLLMHIPPGINAYSSSANSGTSCRSNVRPFWKKQYSNAFLNLTRRFSDVLSDSYSGHTHMDNFRVLSDKPGKPFLFTHITPSVSPVFDNNPAFEVVLYDKKTGEVIDYATYYLKNLQKAGRKEPGKWSLEYSFRKAYGMEAVTPDTLGKLSNLIQSTPSIRRKFMNFYAVETIDQSTPLENSWKTYQCVQTNITAKDFANCYCNYDK